MMLPITSASRASACSWVSFSFLTRRESWPSVTARAFSTAASTNFWSMSLTTTGMSAAAIAWAISPPMVPPPTTAALETNIACESSGVLAWQCGAGALNRRLYGCLRLPLLGLFAVLRPEALIGEGAHQQQQTEGDEGERPGQLFELGEVVGPDLADHQRQQRQATEPDVDRPSHHADDHGAESGGGPEGREPGLADLAGFAALFGADRVDDRDRAQVDEPDRADEAGRRGDLAVDVAAEVPAGEPGEGAGGDRDQRAAEVGDPLGD